MTKEGFVLSGNEKAIWKIGLILAGLFLLMLVLNGLMPLHRDDYDYSMIYMTNIHIETFKDVAYSTYHHYFVHGGRMVTVFCLNLFFFEFCLPYFLYIHINFLTAYF